MSRVGNKSITIPEGVNVSVDDKNFVVVKGPKGELSFGFNAKMKVIIDGNILKVERPSDSIEDKTLHGTTRALLHNMVQGVTTEYSKTLLMEGVGYKATLQGKKLVISAGYSHLVEMPLPDGITVVVSSPTEFSIQGIDKQKVGQFAAEIRAIRKPEPYLGKGIRYKDEVVRRKEGKKAK